MSDVLLTVGGLEYGGWKVARVQCGLDRVAGEFALGVTELWPGQDVTRKIRPGDAAELSVAGQVVVSGYVDAVDLAVGERQHEVSVRGRDKAADLVDCSAVLAPGQWRGKTALALAQALAAPFGVAVAAGVDVGTPLATFALQEGETALEAIDRAARLRGLLVTSDGAGGLLLTRAGVVRADDMLAFGHNVAEARAAFDVRDRYSVYMAKGQSAGGDFWHGEAAAHVKAQAMDPQVTRYRPLLLTGEAPDQAGSLRQRVLWEASVRAARSMQVLVTVPGWTQTSGALWRHNMLVHAQLEPLRLDDDVLIQSVEYSISDAGQVTRLLLTRADAFTVQVLPAAAAAPAGKSAPGAWWDVAGARR